MKYPFLSLVSLIASGSLLAGLLSQEPAKTGPQTEKRFPPLVVPTGFKATLFACDPLIEYPSVIALGPKPGSLFVAIDYMTGLGTDIVRRDEIRLIEDTDGDGYADKATVVATGFNSIQGLAYHDGTLYVMHAPYLSAVPYPPVKGKLDQRRDLLTGIGPPPEKDQIRLHNANGVVLGHDGWLYLAIGDHGANIVRPEGDRFVLENGGILRCRPDGTDLHLFATGLRNIYDVALDEDLNVFVRDNENDGGDYKIRVCHSFFGADHGYPYLYWERPDEAMPPLADLGLGSSAGGACYLERHFPPEYRGNLFFCEWGRSVVRYRPDRVGASFTQPKEIEFAAGAANDPYGFKPTDIVVDHDGTLLVSDWADGQRPRRGRGRIYRITHVNSPLQKPPAPINAKTPLAEVFARLDSHSYFERLATHEVLLKRGLEAAPVTWDVLLANEVGVRAQMHSVWIVAKLGRHESIANLLYLAKTDIDLRIQVQAIRAIADLTDPVLVKHKLEAGRGDPHVATRIAKLAEDRDARVMLEAVIALGRLRWNDAPAWLHRHVKPDDPAMAHAAQITLRKCDNWPAVLKLLDEPSSDPFRKIAVRAVAGQYESTVIDGLIGRLSQEKEPKRRQEYADLLSRIYKKPATPWTYWGFRPAPRPSNTVAWEWSDLVAAALDRVLADPDRTVRLETLRRMLREKVPAQTRTLGKWLQEDREPARVSAILQALHDRPGAEIRSLLEGVIDEKDHAAVNRVAAAGQFIETLEAAAEGRLLALAEKTEDGPVLAPLLQAMGTRPKIPASAILRRKLTSSAPEVRAAAIVALTEWGEDGAGDQARKLFGDPDSRVRAAAAQATARIQFGPAADQLVKLAADPDAAVRRESINALRRIKEPRVIALAEKALGDRDTVFAALDALGDGGGPDQSPSVVELARRNPSADVLASVGKVLTRWADRPNVSGDQRRAIDSALAEIHGSSGVLLAWRIVGPMKPAAAAELLPKLQSGSPTADSRLMLAGGIDARIALGRAASPDDTWLAQAELTASGPEPVEFFAASSGLATIWLNGKTVYRREKPGVIGPYPDRFEALLQKGRNVLVVQLSGVKAMAEFQVRFRRKTATADQERYTLAALSRAGNPAAGREIFFNAEKSLCIRCHRIGDQGERIGPELTGVGARFSKIYIVESILQPSRTIAPSFETITVSLKNGKVVSGVKVAETETTLTLGDTQAVKHTLNKADIEEQQKQPTSTMPEGTEKRLTEDEFVDLVSFLANLKDMRGR